MQTESIDAQLARCDADLAHRRWGAAHSRASAVLRVCRSKSAAWYTLGRALKEGGDWDAALACYRRALMIEPSNPTVLTSLGTAYFGLGQPDRAIRAYRAALAVQPDHAGARASLDVLERPAPAGARPLVQLRAEAQRLHAAGRLAEALSLHREALRCAPQSAMIWLSAGMLLNEMNAQQESLRYFEQAARLDGSLYPAVEAARRICVSAGLIEKADRYSAQAAALRPDPEIGIARALTIDAIPVSAAAISAARNAYEAGLDAAIAAGRLARDLDAAQGMGGYFLAYHGENDRRLQIKAAELLLIACPALNVTAAHCLAPARRPGRIRIGFISAFLFNHSIGTTTLGLIEKLSRDRFEVVVIRILPSADDALTARIRRGADRSIDLDPELRTAQNQIAALELDVLFFQDIGMEPRSGRLACARLAPVQCVSFGHPNTTGIPNMDYFISNDLYEPPDAADHYSETLFKLHDLPTLAYYYRPAAPLEPPRRESYGLLESDHVYLCPQTLFKFHPDFDATLADILRRDPDGILVLIRGQFDEYTDKLNDRLTRALQEVSDRLLFLDRMSSNRYMGLLMIADVCLDTPHFNGMNSSLEAFAVGTPIVTLPGRMQRGRHTQAMYRKMGISDCIAADLADYADMAIRLACDAGFAGGIRARIRANSRALFEDPRVVSEFERFFQTAVRNARPDWIWTDGAAR